jgi:hypothetical protein
MIPDLERIERLLWEEWDPIGVNETDCPNDEYDSYAIQVFSKLKSGVNVRELEAYLDWADSENMGLSGLPGRNREIAQRIIDLFRASD